MAIYFPIIKPFRHKLGTGDTARGPSGFDGLSLGLYLSKSNERLVRISFVDKMCTLPFSASVTPFNNSQRCRLNIIITPPVSSQMRKNTRPGLD